MRELQALCGSDFVQELSVCNGLEARELGELRSLAAELERERSRRPRKGDEEANHRAIAEALLQTYDTSADRFVSAREAEQQALREVLRDALTVEGEVPMPVLRAMVSSVARLSKAENR